MRLRASSWQGLTSWSQWPTVVAVTQAVNRSRQEQVTRSYNGESSWAGGVGRGVLSSCWEPVCLWWRALHNRAVTYRSPVPWKPPARRARISFIYSFIHSIIHSFILSFAHSFTLSTRDHLGVDKSKEGAGVGEWGKEVLLQLQSQKSVQIKM